MKQRIALFIVFLFALFTAYGGPLRPGPVHWLSDHVDIPGLRD